MCVLEVCIYIHSHMPSCFASTANNIHCSPASRRLHGNVPAHLPWPLLALVDIQRLCRVCIVLTATAEWCHCFGFLVFFYLGLGLLFPPYLSVFFILSTFHAWRDCNIVRCTRLCVCARVCAYFRKVGGAALNPSPRCRRRPGGVLLQEPR